MIIMIIMGHFSGCIIFSFQLFVLIEYHAFRNQRTLFIRPTSLNNCERMSDSFLYLSLFFLSFCKKKKKRRMKNKKKTKDKKARN